MYFNDLKVLDDHNVKHFEKIAYTIPLKNYQYLKFLLINNYYT